MFFSSSSDTAFCQNQNDLKWYLFDDNSVSEINEQAVVVSAVRFIIYKVHITVLPICIVILTFHYLHCCLSFSICTLNTFSQPPLIPGSSDFVLSVSYVLIQFVCTLAQNLWCHYHCDIHVYCMYGLLARLNYRLFSCLSGVNTDVSSSVYA